MSAVEKLQAMRRILVVKLGALGDFVQADPAFRAIRAAHPKAEITCLTTPGLKDAAAAAPYFDVVWDDGRPEGDAAWRALVKRTRAAKFDRVYDLQCNDRSSALFVALWPFPPQWSGVAPLASHRHKGRENFDHALERMADQLARAGVGSQAGVSAETATPDWGWAARRGRGATEKFALRRPFGLIAVGCSAKRPEKRWPDAALASLARALIEEGVTPVLIGGEEDRARAGLIAAGEARIRDATGRTSLLDLAALGAEASFFVGADTGPCHLLAAAGARGVVVFGPASDPARHAPRGEAGVVALTGDPIDKVDVPDVTQALRALGGLKTRRAAS